jgi:hypothetical protein
MREPVPGPMPQLGSRPRMSGPPISFLVAALLASLSILPDAAAEPMVDTKGETGLKLDPAYAAAGRGWISGRLAGATLVSERLRGAPRLDAPIVARMSGENWGPDSVAVKAIHACAGRYVEVTGVPIGGKAVRGWSYSPCSNQLTTCDHSGAAD